MSETRLKKKWKILYINSEFNKNFENPPGMELQWCTSCADTKGL